MGDLEFQDSSGQVLQDLLLWIEQNQGVGSGLYFDAGEPQPLAEPKAAQIPEPTTAPAARNVTLPEKTKLPPLPDLISASDPFKAECDQFVHQAMALIRKQKTLGQDTLSVDPMVDQYGGQAEAMADLKGTVKGCQTCDLHKSRTSTVFGTGNPNAAIVFVGEAPGRDEDLQGEPFVGQSGQLLTKILGAIGLSRDEIFICNILKCRPPGNRDPEPGEVADCENHLKRQLAILQPRLICCLGRIAAQTLLGTEDTLGSLRQSVHFYQGIPVMATYHPAALLRNPSWKKDTWNDVRKLRVLHDVLDLELR